MRALASLRLSPSLRGYLHVAGLALVVCGGAVLELTDDGTAGALVAIVGLVLLALQPRHPEEG